MVKWVVCKDGVVEKLDIYILNMIFMVHLCCVNCIFLLIFGIITVSVICTSNYVVKLSKLLVTDAQPSVVYLSKWYGTD